MLDVIVLEVLGRARAAGLDGGVEERLLVRDMLLESDDEVVDLREDHGDGRIVRHRRRPDPGEDAAERPAERLVDRAVEVDGGDVHRAALSHG